MNRETKEVKDIIDTDIELVTKLLNADDREYSHEKMKAILVDLEGVRFDLNLVSKRLEKM